MYVHKEYKDRCGNDNHQIQEGHYVERREGISRDSAIFVTVYFSQEAPK